MCLLLVATDHPDYRLLVAANRDEFYTRPTAPAAFWADHRKVLAGRDLERMGTWLGIDQHGRFAAVTNIRGPAGAPVSPRSRGLITSDFLAGSQSARDYTRALDAHKTLYEGCNLIVADAASTLWWSTQTHASHALPPGVYGLSNHLLDTPWPKVTRIKEEFAKIAALRGAALAAALFAVLADGARAPDEDLPRTGIEIPWERALSSIFVVGEEYGTRSSTVVLISRDRDVTFIERRYGPAGRFFDERRFAFTIEEDRRTPAAPS